MVAILPLFFFTLQLFWAKNSKLRYESKQNWSLVGFWWDTPCFMIRLVGLFWGWNLCFENFGGHHFGYTLRWFNSIQESVAEELQTTTTSKNDENKRVICNKKGCKRFDRKNCANCRKAVCWGNEVVLCETHWKEHNEELAKFKLFNHLDFYKNEVIFFYENF